MPRTPRRLAAAAFVAAIGTAAVIPTTRPTAAAPVPADTPTTVSPARVVGNPSCAAASCHGGDGRPGTTGSEHGTVAAYDPHRKMFSVLFQERSERMVRNLAGGTSPAPAHQTALCLKCHGASPPNLSEVPGPTDSVHRWASCENCHGAAENYLTTHFTAGWKALPASEKAAAGLVPTKSLADRAKMCAGCHVGAPDREVDHKLIAAGHPALRFELAAYQAEPLYVRHWPEKVYGPDAEAWEWLIGQAASARSAAELLRHRADEAEKGVKTRDWPEFAEYACYSCHQTVGTGAISTKRANSPKVGQLPWNSWVYPLALKLGDGASADWTRPSAKPAGLFNLAALFRDSDRPDPAKTRAAATTAVADLDRWLTALQATAERRSLGQSLTPAELRAALGHVIQFAGEVPTTDAASTDWDRYTQGFLAVAALYRALIRVDSTARDQQLEAGLRGLAAGLKFPAGVDGPKWSAADRERHLKAWAAVAARLDSGGRP
jgi:hypothetical protein